MTSTKITGHLQDQKDDARSSALLHIFLAGMMMTNIFWCFVSNNYLGLMLSVVALFLNSKAGIEKLMVI